MLRRARPSRVERYRPKKVAMKWYAATDVLHLLSCGVLKMIMFMKTTVLGGSMLRTTESRLVSISRTELCSGRKRFR